MERFVLRQTILFSGTFFLLFYSRKSNALILQNGLPYVYEWVALLLTLACFWVISRSEKSFVSDKGDKRSVFIAAVLVIIAPMGLWFGDRNIYANFSMLGFSVLSGWGLYKLLKFAGFNRKNSWKDILAQGLIWSALAGSSWSYLQKNMADETTVFKIRDDFAQASWSLSDISPVFTLPIEVRFSPKMLERFLFNDRIRLDIQVLFYPTDKKGEKKIMSHGEVVASRICRLPRRVLFGGFYESRCAIFNGGDLLPGTYRVVAHPVLSDEEYDDIKVEGFETMRLYLEVLRL